MIYLLGSIILASYLTLSFKVLERLNIPTFQSIVFNYIACVITGSLVDGAFPLKPAIMDEPWLPWAGLMGFSFIFLFNIIAFTAQKLGVAIASVANKLSMVIPFIFSLYLYNEEATPLRLAGIGVALVAVVCTSWPEGGKAHNIFVAHQRWIYIIPFILFLGSGLLDTLVKYVEQGFLREDNKNAYLITAFAVAALIGLYVPVDSTDQRERKIRPACGACGHPDRYTQLFLHLVPGAGVKGLWRQQFFDHPYQ